MINYEKASIRIQNVLKAINLPSAYMTFQSGIYTDEEGNEIKVDPPFVVYLGAGQQQAYADDTIYWSEDTYTLEYYFIEKSSKLEEEIEAAILAERFHYEKSEDAYIDDEDIFVIYYTLR